MLCFPALLFVRFFHLCWLPTTRGGAVTWSTPAGLATHLQLINGQSSNLHLPAAKKDQFTHPSSPICCETSSANSPAHILIPAYISWFLLSSFVLIFTIYFCFTAPTPPLVPVRLIQPVPSSIMAQSPLVLSAVTSTWTPWIIADCFFPVKELKQSSGLCLHSGLIRSAVKYSNPDTSIPDQKQHKQFLCLRSIFPTYRKWDITEILNTSQTSNINSVWESDV